MKTIMTILCSCIIIFLYRCSDTNPSGTNNDPTRNCFRKFPYTTLASAMKIIEDSTYCAGDDLRYKYDTVNALYHVSTAVLQIAVYDTMSQGVTLHEQNYTRIGTSTGLTDWWDLTSHQVSLVSGTLTQAELDKIDEDTAFINTLNTAGDLQIEITADTVYYYYIGSIADVLLRLFNDYLANIPNPELFAVTIQKTGDKQVTLTGVITGEVVTIGADDKFNQTVSSTRAAHETYTNYVRIEECPIDDPLYWLIEFVYENPSYAEIYMMVIDSAGLLDSVDAGMSKINDTVVTVTGNKSLEVITVTLHRDSTINYTSSKPEHAPYQTTWNEFGMPQWIVAFYIDNAITRRREQAFIK